ncbi:MAG: hypothetical protein NC218_01930 [Acetobacter sp.]|nr:hypothetical protein [Acetobacter sp.]
MARNKRKAAAQEKASLCIKRMDELLWAASSYKDGDVEMEPKAAEKITKEIKSLSEFIQVLVGEK